VLSIDCLMSEIVVVGIFGFDRKSHSVVNRLSTFRIQIRIHLQDNEPGLRKREELV
jgi:hypothetical protein